MTKKQLQQRVEELEKILSQLLDTAFTTDMATQSKLRKKAKDILDQVDKK